LRSKYEIFCPLERATLSSDETVETDRDFGEKEKLRELMTVLLLQSCCDFLFE
jgi:hypothetical protein